MALFDAAERLAGRYPGFLGVRTFVDSLADQQIPAEAVADRGTRADAVRILTAHRAKGLEWDEVWVVGAEEGVWPDLRARGSTLRAEELTATGIGSGPRPADLLEEERRLFYVACTRARRQLHVTAIDEKDAGGERPSRFLDDVRSGAGRAGDEPPVSGRPRHQVSLDGLVAELRLVATDPQASPTLRQAAVERLAVLAAQRDADGEPLVPLADPAPGGACAEPTSSDRPVRDPEHARVAVGQRPRRHPRLPAEVVPRARGARRDPARHGDQLRQRRARRRRLRRQGRGPGDPRRTWTPRSTGSGPSCGSRRAGSRSPSGARREPRWPGSSATTCAPIVSSSAPRPGSVPRSTVPTPDGGTETVRLSGFIDRVERDAEGRLVPIDLKNMRDPVRAEGHPRARPARRLPAAAARGRAARCRAGRGAAPAVGRRSRTRPAAGRCGQGVG